jgi:hypothetical protein
MPLPSKIVTGLEHGRIETRLDRVPRSDHSSWPRADDRHARTPLLHVASVPARAATPQGGPALIAASDDDQQSRSCQDVDVDVLAAARRDRSRTKQTSYPGPTRTYTRLELAGANG